MVISPETIKLQDCKLRQEPKSILMCGCDYFDVIDSKNPFMNPNINKVDINLAKHQWQELYKLLTVLGIKVFVLDAVANLEDMVFTANQVLVGNNASLGNYVVAANMKYESRNREIPYFVQWFKAHNYKILNEHYANESVDCIFEGHGDALWHPNHELLWVGFGYRSTKKAIAKVPELIQAPVITLELVDANFYHLDTCFFPIDENTLMYYPEAFSKKTNDIICQYFKNLVVVSRKEALNFACNSIVFNDTIIIQSGNNNTVDALQKLGYKTAGIDVGEFMKSGGGISCLTLWVY